jgi:hypothetical protein
MGGGGMRAGVGWEVSKYKNTPVSSNTAATIFFRAKDFFVDDDSRLSAVGSVR